MSVGLVLSCSSLTFLRIRSKLYRKQSCVNGDQNNNSKGEMKQGKYDVMSKLQKISQKSLLPFKLKVTKFEASVFTRKSSSLLKHPKEVAFYNPTITSLNQSTGQCSDLTDSLPLSSSTLSSSMISISRLLLYTLFTGYSLFTSSTNSLVSASVVVLVMLGMRH